MADSSSSTSEFNGIGDETGSSNSNNNKVCNVYDICYIIIIVIEEEEEEEEDANT